MEPIQAEVGMLTAEASGRAIAQPSDRASSVTVGISLFTGVEELDFAGPMEVLGAWNCFSDKTISVRTVAEDSSPIRCAHGLVVLSDYTWADAPTFDLIIIPGGNTEPRLDRQLLRERYRQLASTDTILASVCTGALELAAAGLLDGRRATTHHGSFARLQAMGSGIVIESKQRFVDTGSVVTAAGISAGIDMALHLVSRLDSPAVAQRVRHYIEYAR